MEKGGIGGAGQGLPEEISVSRDLRRQVELCHRLKGWMYQSAGTAAALAQC